MAKRYIIDGYNLLHRWRRGALKPGPGNLENARTALIQWIARKLPNDRVTVVFDSAQSAAPGSSESRQAGVRIVFPHDFASADEWIIEELRSNAGNPEFMVITSDREIQLAARRSRIAHLDSDTFLAQVSEDPRDRLQSDKPLRGKSLPTPDEKKPLLAEDLASFREQMEEGIDIPIVESEEPKPDESTKTPPPLKEKPPGQGEDLSDFYRKMREFDPE